MSDSKGVLGAALASFRSASPEERALLAHKVGREIKENHTRCIELYGEDYQDDWPMVYGGIEHMGLNDPEKEKE